MTAADATAPEDGAILTIDAVLSPAEAGSVCAKAREAMDAAEKAGSGVAIDLDEGDPTPCAIQLLVSALRSGQKRSIPVAFGDRAQAVLDSIQIH